MGGAKGRHITLSEREQAISLVKEATSNGASKEKVCNLMEVSKRTVTRWKSQEDKVKEDGRLYSIKTPSNRLTQEEQNKIISIATSEEFCDLSVRQIVPKLADQGEYIASESSFYRILKKEKLNAHRGKSKPKTNSRPKSYTTNTQNNLWSWDITYLPSIVKGQFFYLYLIIDIFSRKIVGYNVYENESAQNSSAVIRAAYKSEQINGETIVVHSDNGKPMKGSTMISTLHMLGIIPSFSRPSVSNDNPYSESIFKTLKYCPKYPSTPFENLKSAKDWVDNFVNWYNNYHQHSSIKFVTPSERHKGEDSVILENRKKIYENARKKNPSRWSGNIRNWDYVSSVSLNPSNSQKKAA